MLVHQGMKTDHQIPSKETYKLEIFQYFSYYDNHGNITHSSVSCLGNDKD